MKKGKSCLNIITNIVLTSQISEKGIGTHLRVSQPHFLVKL